MSVRRLLFLVVILVFLLFQGSSSQLYINSSQTVYERNSSVNLVYEADRPGNYTLNVTDSSGSLVARKNFTEVNASNTSGNLYEVNHFTRRPYGQRYADIFTEDPNNTVNVQETGFFVVGDSPVILEHEISPPIRFVNQELTSRVRVADSAEDVQVSEISVENRKMDMQEQNESAENVQVFSRDFNITEVGSYSYQLNLVDSSGFSDSLTGNFLVESGPRRSDTNVTVSIDNECLNVTSTLSAPGNEPVNIITRNTSGSFLGEFYNRGNLPHQAVVGIDVTFEGNESWSPGEEKGPVVVSYEPKNFTIPGNGKGEYFRKFVAAYEPGNYTGRMRVQTQCNDELDNTTLTTDYNLTDNFEIVDVEGEDSLLENGSQTTNQSIPADASRRGSESDQTLEGDNPEPGSTTRPESEPQPSLSINMETINATYSTSKNQFKEIGITVENYADTLQQVQLTPQVDGLEGDWNVRSATIAQISPQLNLNTSVFLQPSDSVPAGNYRVPVMARLLSGRSLDVEYINIDVTEEVLESNLSIVEAPQVLNIQRNTSTQIPVLLRNTGTRPLENVSLQVQNIDSCGRVGTSEEVQIPVNESKSQNIVFTAGSSVKTCRALVIASSDSGAYAFANIEVNIRPKEGFVPERFRVPLIASLWTIVLVLYALATRRFELDSYMIKIPFLMLVIGETVIFLYLAANYYGIIPPELLPF